MPDKLDEIFRTYTEAVEAKLRNKTETPRREARLRLLPNKAMELGASVDELENAAEFYQLVLQTRSSFSGDYHGKSESAWQRAIEDFFRRSGYYTDVSEGKSLSVDTALSNYREAFQRREIQITYLAPIEFVRFAENSMEFGTFQVRRFAADELEAIFQNTVSEVFYPWAVIDAKRLRDYWFVHVTEIVPAPQIGEVRIPWDLIGRVDIQYTGYPKVIESVLQQLALFNWQIDGEKETPTSQEKDLETGWHGFHIPFVLRRSDHLLRSPWVAPDLSRLETESDFDPQTGEEIGERPTVYIYLDEDQTESLKTFIQRTGKLLSGLNVQQNGREFLEIALGFFIKAFFAEGLEQMLWHVATLEALLGEKGLPNDLLGGSPRFWERARPTEKLSRNSSRSCMIFGPTWYMAIVLRKGSMWGIFVTPGLWPGERSSGFCTILVTFRLESRTTSLLRTCQPVRISLPF